MTLRMACWVWNLRSQRSFRVVRRALERTNERGLVGVAHYSIQGNHVHLIVESRDRRVLAAGIKGLEVRLARGLNRMMGRAGRVIGDRYFTTTLASASAVRNALAYVLLNRTRHFPVQKGFDDPYSSAVAFDGFSRPPRRTWPFDTGPPPVVPPTTALLSTRWRVLGPIDPSFVPGRPRPPSTPIA